MHADGRAKKESIIEEEGIEGWVLEALSVFIFLRSVFLK
jgi:hypothetical protein